MHSLLRNDMPTSTLTSKGQATIPKPIREALRLQPGDRVEFALEGDRVVLRRASADLTALDGLLDRSGRNPVSVDAMHEAIERVTIERVVRGETRNT
jgi:AbrB family looped-hinge helix DNA binding protein